MPYFMSLLKGTGNSDSSTKKIDILLEQEAYVEHLRRFRNAVFHYQKDPLNLKLLNFLDAKDSEIWIKTLYRAFEEFFQDTLHINEQLTRMGWNDTE